MDDGTAPLLRTERLRLRTWTDADAAELHRLSNDPEVMRFFPSMPSRSAVDELVARHRTNLATGRPGLFAVERLQDGRFLGFVGLAVPGFEGPFGEVVEIGWRLDRPFWGQGYATEAARETLRHGFETLDLDEVVSFTATQNVPSTAVMRRLGMRHDPAGDFDHPRVPVGHPLRRHVLYRLRREEWREQRRLRH